MARVGESLCPGQHHTDGTAYVGKKIEHEIVQFVPPNYDYLLSPSKFDAREQLAVHGRLVVVRESKMLPAGGVHMLLFPTINGKASMTLGAVGGFVSIANPSAITDEDGHFSIRTGPLWKFTNRAVVALISQKSPEHPFDVDVISDSSDKGNIAVSEDTNEVDVGDIQLQYK